jgi:hypothetical protein
MPASSQLAGLPPVLVNTPMSARLNVSYAQACASAPTADEECVIGAYTLTALEVECVGVYVNSR